MMMRRTTNDMKFEDDDDYDDEEEEGIASSDEREEAQHENDKAGRDVELNGFVPRPLRYPPPSGRAYQKRKKRAAATARVLCRANERLAARQLVW